MFGMPALRSAAVPRRPIVVAIPAKDEADRIACCLTAIDQQDQPPDLVITLLNNCTDGTEAVVRALQPKLACPQVILVRKLPVKFANAGHARRIAMNAAARLAGSEGVLLTTDADAVPPPDWISRNMAAIHNGVDAVCGLTMLDPAEEQLIPLHVRHDEILEQELITLQDGFAAFLDPEAHDPLPRHTEAPGASLALTVTAFHRAGGIPALPSGEDRALVRALWEKDARIRHDPGVRVTVSGRTVGRATGGMADTLRRRLVRRDEFADERAEPSLQAWHRYGLRNHARRCWAGRRDPALSTALGLSVGQEEMALQQPYFGAAWAALEATSPMLIRQRVRFVDLPREIAIARELLQTDVLAAD